MIRISGEEALAVADRVFRAASGRPLSEKQGYTAAYGGVYDGKGKLDESVATVFRAPHSYTGEDVVELSCHGGIVVTREVLRAVLDNGAVLAEAGEFTKRAFLNGKTVSYTHLICRRSAFRLIIAVRVSKSGGEISVSKPHSNRDFSRSSSVLISFGGRSEVSTICLPT